MMKNAGMAVAALFIVTCFLITWPWRSVRLPPKAIVRPSDGKDKAGKG